MFSVKSAFALAAAALCLIGPQAIAQSAPVAYWNPGWLGFGGNLDAGQGGAAEGNAAGFSSNTAGGFSVSRYTYPNGFFVGAERGSFGLGLSGINQPGVFGSTAAQGAQFGYTLKNSPVSVFGGVDTFKYDSGIPSAFSNLNSLTGTVPGGYGVHAGVEFKPSSNVSLSLGAGFTQQSGRVDTDTQSAPMSIDSQFGLVGARR